MLLHHSNNFMKKTALITLVVQCAWILCLSFSPVVNAKMNEVRELGQRIQSLQAVLGLPSPSEPTVLPPGDSTDKNDNNIPQRQQQSLSQGALSTRTTPSRLLTVPQTPFIFQPPVAVRDMPSALPDLGSDATSANKKITTEPPADKVVQNRNTELDNNAYAAQQLWSVLGGPSPREQGIQMATGIATGIANQTAEDWLNQFGHARISFSTQGIGSADLLVPLLDTPDNLLYTQAGGRRADSRTTTNLGLGWRTFSSDWMLGVNTFYDYDVTGNNRRLGVGAEVWRDYLKLSANSYFRLSDWHQSPMSVSRDYDERPANGYDIRAEGWLPAYPQLGGKLVYEHYQGKGVALDGNFDNRKDNPSAVTAGISYTPFPLLKLGVEHTSGSGINDTTLTMDFSYRLGAPWVDQINPASVGFGHSLMGSRYDLADRNYNIVLQYRKQDLISLLLNADRNPGFAGESVMVTADVRTKYGLSSVLWDAPTLLAAGGNLTPLAKIQPGWIYRHQH